MSTNARRALYISTLLITLAVVTTALGAVLPHTAQVRPAGRTEHRGRHAQHKPGTVVHRPSVRSTAGAASMLVGDALVEWRYDFLAAGQAEAFELKAGASGVARSIHVYVAPGSTARTLTAGIYSARAGHPGHLLGAGSIAAPQAGTWVSVSIPPTTLVAGRRYWLAILGAHGTLRYRDSADGSCPSLTSAGRRLGALPSSWRTGKSYADCPVSAYVTPAPTGAVESFANDAAPLQAAVGSARSAPPLVKTLPHITGKTVEGQVLSTSNGTWSGSPTSFKYQWRRCGNRGDCPKIAGATTAAYTLTEKDVGAKLRVTVTATNAAGSSAAESEPTAPITAPPPAPTNSSLPAVKGTAAEGQTLTSSNGTWTGSPTSYEHQWQDCTSSGKCTNIEGATGASYVLAAGDVGQTVRIVVTATNAGGSTQAASAATATVVVSPPTDSTPPAISGTPVEGQTLTSTTGTWTGSPTFARHWERCSTAGTGCAEITGATGASYHLASADVGHTVRVIVRGSNSAGSAEATSNPTAEVTAPKTPPTNSKPPLLSGTPEVGQKLTSSTGTWTGEPTSYGYQWQQCEASGKNCANISGATGSSYVLASRDLGHTVRVVVTASNSGGSAEAASAVSGTVTGSAPGAQIYVSQGGAGNQSGEGGCSAAHSLAWLNSGADWGSGSGHVAPGTTVDLCGTFSGPLEAKGNGSAGKPITIEFMPGAKLAEPSCPGTGCINLPNNSEYITIDGGTNGVIENTNRGTHKEAGTAATTGIYAWGCKHCTFEHLEIANLYVASQGDATSNTEIRGIVVTGGEIEDVAIDNDVLHDIGWAVVVSLSGKSHNVEVEGDTLYHDSHGIAMTASASGTALGPAIVAHDHFYADGVWSASPGTNHMDALHCYSGAAGVHWSAGLFVYDNTFTMEGEYGVTADAYVEGTTGPECGNSTSNFWIFNNVMTAKGAGPLFAVNNGLLSPYSGQDHIFNNTFIGNKTSEGVCVPLGGVPSSTSANVQYKNNISSTCQTVMDVERSKLAAGGAEYNLYANSGGTNDAFVCNGTGYYPSEFSKFQSCTGQESHSISVGEAKLNLTETAGVLGKPEAGSEALAHGTNLTSLCSQTPAEALCKNINGEPRPATGAWNIGAF